jgi:glycosidase
MIKYNFHVSKHSRLKYQFDKSLFSLRGTVIIAHPKNARELSNSINEKRKSEGLGHEPITPGQINALGLLHEIFHFIIGVYKEKENAGVFSRAFTHLMVHLGDAELTKVLNEFCNEFPPLEVYKGNTGVEEYLNGNTSGVSNKEILLEELILLHLENINPALTSLEELFSDIQISKRTKYVDLLGLAEEFFQSEKPFGEESLSLIQFLRKPIVTFPFNIDTQLDYIREKWRIYIDDALFQKLLKGQDLIREDLKLFIKHGGGEKATPPVPEYKFDEEYLKKIRDKLKAGEELTDAESYYYSEIEKFTQDTDWMPKVVMIAKNVYVWLFQLSKQYNRLIQRLDQIPDEELDKLASWNFNALWLIGVWERSSASKKIKVFTGNPEAAPSAYSIYNYTIAHQLGGEEAFENLKARAMQRGIRLASDMVPNHTGIYSKWIVEKPHYFLQTNNHPYPSYTFTGPNLSEDERVEVRIEDKYYSRQDAAVVFERRDRYTGDKKYIYHGNDGTNMPWNDTAQLNFLNPEVREAVIQTIMHVAQQFPIIRFDAAMTLAKKHYQRLWFPKPGTGGAIPSRSDYSMSQNEFDRSMPTEFWREVVDRINSEMPNTLLLAEAFWLMEGYFVRTLGMHRVYNSAFMHMLMKDENDKYKQLIKNTLEFNPEILKRYVNFMSNPDEETAVNQFGKGDKYFGVALMMATLPGLPMFAHGQIEGFAEKYGMEYQRSYYDEFVDEHLVNRHREEIFPLLKQRYLFSQVSEFELYDFFDDLGNVNENVFAFSNRSGTNKALILYNNSYSEAKGTIRHSANKAVMKSGEESKYYTTKNLTKALDLKTEQGYFYIYSDHKTNLEYLISGRELNDFGFHIYLGGYQSRVCMNFREAYDTNGQYERLNNYLSGKGVPSIFNALHELQLLPVHNKCYELLNYTIKEEFERYCLDYKINNTEKLLNAFNSLIIEINHFSSPEVNPKTAVDNLKQDVKNLRDFNNYIYRAYKRKNSAKWFKQAAEELLILNPDNHFYKEILFAVTVLNRVVNPDDHNNLYHTLMFDKVISNYLQQIESNQKNLAKEMLLIKLLLKNRALLQVKNLFDNSKDADKNAGSKLIEFLNHSAVFNFINLNEFDGILYYSKENMETLLGWIYYFYNASNSNTVSEKKGKLSSNKKSTQINERLKNSFEIITQVKQLSGSSGYRWEEFREGLSKLEIRNKSTVKKRTASKSKRKTN